MRARIEREVLRDQFKVWLYIEGENTPSIMRFDGEQRLTVLEQVSEGATVEPTFTIPALALEALLREASGFVAATDATTRHLDDAVAVRDRLLALVERGKPVSP